MVASVSARRNIAAARQYYSHLKTDDYYRAAVDTNSQWSGRAAKILGLNGAISKAAFTKVLMGICPTTGNRLVQSGRNHKKHAPGWDVTLSAPKAVSLLWALAPTSEQQTAIENAHKNAAQSTIKDMEQKYTWCRRGKGGRTHEQTAGLLVAAFTHHTSRNLDPQLHEHLFVLNMSPRKDGTWGAIQSKPFYRAQKSIGAVYRQHLARELTAVNIPAEIRDETITIPPISRAQEQAFSSRRRDILEAVRNYSYTHTPKGLEKAALRTRQSKRLANIAALRHIWQHRGHSLALNLAPLYERMPTKQCHADADTSQIKTPRQSLSLSQEIFQRLVQAAQTVLSPARKSVQLVQPSKLKLAAFGLINLMKNWQTRASTQKHNPARHRRR